MAPSRSSDRATVDGAMGGMRRMHVMLIAIVVAATGLAWYVGRPPDDPAAPRATWDSVQLIFGILVALAAGTLAMVPVLRRKMLPRVPPNVRYVGDAEAAGRAEAALIRRYVSGFVFTSVLAASVGIYGVVLSSMLKAMWPYPIFAGPALFALYWFRPRRADLTGRIEELHRAGE